MAGYTLSALEAAIRSYTEVSSTVLTGAILGRFIENAEYRIFYDVPIDAYRYVSEGNLAIDDNTINVPGLGTKGLTGTVFVRGVEVFNSTVNTEGKGTWLIKKEVIAVKNTSTSTPVLILKRLHCSKHTRFKKSCTACAEVTK